MTQVAELFARRQRRVRFRVRRDCGHRPRLSVFRSNMHIYAQVIDDRQGRTLCAASSLDKTIREEVADAKGSVVAAAVGRLLAERALAAGVGAVVFDRGGYRFHGRVKALADAARTTGLTF